MKRKNMTRSALITSIISLLLCVSMLVGTTFAWFTDSVESGRNTIAAGNLDVELYHSDKDNSGYVTAETELFNDVTLWEPGVVVYENFKVENVGSLALKYQLSINFENETKVNGHGLSEALDVAVVVGGVKGTREQVIASAAEWTDLQSFTLSGVLEGETTSETYGIVIYWQPTEDDNLFNMNNDLKGNTLSIDLGVNLFATQEMYEEDSFGEDYDENAWHNAMQVYTEADLNAAIANGESAIMLMADITATESIVIPEGATVALNLNGKTISNETGYVFENKGSLAITGDGTITGLGGIRSTAGNVLIENGNFYCSSRWQNSTYQHTLKAENTNVIINGGNFDATVNGQTNAVLNASTGSTITINGGSFKNVSGDLTQFDPYLFTYEKDGAVIINNGTFYGGWRFNGETATTNIYGGTFTVGFDGQSFNASSTHVVTVYGGTFASQTNAKLTDKLSAIVAEGCHVVQNDGLYYVVSDDIKLVFTAVALQNALNDATGTTNIVLGGNITGDVTVSEKDGVHITVDGNGNTYNGSITVDGNTARNTGSLTIQNVNFKAESLSTDAYINLGGSDDIRYTDNVAVKNCTFSGDGFVAIKSYTGGDQNLTVTGCTVNAGMHSMLQVSNVETGLTVTNCKVYSKNGINLNNTPSLTMSGCEFNVTGYAVRIGVNNATNNGTFTISDSTLTSANDDGDAVIILRGTMTGATLALTNTTLNGDPEISGEAIVTIDGAVQKSAASQDELAAAAKSGSNVSITLSDGTYTVPSVTGGSTVTIKGTEDTVINLTANCAPSGQTVSTINFEGVTITGSAYTNGMTYTKATYTDCVFKTVNTYLYNDTKFVGCDFYVNGDYYALWTWGAGTVEFVDCDFYTQGKAVYMNANHTTHKDGYTHEDVYFTDCRFYDQGDDTITNKAAIEIGDDYNRAVYNLYIKNTTVEGFAVTEQKQNLGGTSLGTNVWGNKYLIPDTNLNVVIDGVDVY